MNPISRARLTDFMLRNATLIIFVAVFAWFGISADNFFGVDNALNILKQASFTGIIAVGMTFVLLTAGIDLSVGSNMYVSAMTVGYFLMLPGMQGQAGAAAGIVVGLTAGAVFGAINAFSIVVLRITPFLATLATMVAGHGLVTAVTESFGLDYPVAFTSSRRRVYPRPAGADHRLRAGRRGGACRVHPHRLRPAALRRRQRP